ncbi:hypothetical protein [Nocardia sp. AG03]|uniref:hypothetical protein n=1 Tax=Nocardia sp. AG03 TaxID=3025312 RepID=UPI002418505A|nr:hypothetical protein [Nocardia sp. AG03]
MTVLTGRHDGVETRLRFHDDRPILDNVPNPADRFAALLVADRDRAAAAAQTAQAATRQILLVVTRRSGV